MQWNTKYAVAGYLTVILSEGTKNFLRLFEKKFSPKNIFHLLESAAKVVPTCLGRTEIESVSPKSIKALCISELPFIGRCTSHPQRPWLWVYIHFII